MKMKRRAEKQHAGLSHGQPALSSDGIEQIYFKRG